MCRYVDARTQVHTRIVGHLLSCVMPEDLLHLILVFVIRHSGQQQNTCKIKNDQTLNARATNFAKAHTAQ